MFQIKNTFPQFQGERQEFHVEDFTINLQATWNYKRLLWSYK